MLGIFMTEALKTVWKFLLVRESRWRSSCRSCCVVLHRLSGVFHHRKGPFTPVLGEKTALFFPLAAQELSGELEPWPSVSSVNGMIVLKCMNFTKNLIIHGNTPTGLVQYGPAQLRISKDTNRQEITQLMSIKSCPKKEGDRQKVVMSLAAHR